jgi:uncharacterized protein YbjT (DUF2867 family)
MVGQGVLRECLVDGAVTSVLAVGRSASGQSNAKLTELVHRDLLDFSTVATQLAGYDACFYCLGVSSAGMSETDYERVTYDMTLAAARTLVERNPAMTFVYVSGSGSDSTESGRSMWARVKGKTENALLKLPFKRVYMFRCGFIRPLHGIRSKTRMYRIVYVIAWPFYPLLKLLAPGAMTTTETVGRAIINAATRGAPKPLLENRDINELGRT